MLLLYFVVLKMLTLKIIKYLYLLLLNHEIFSNKQNYLKLKCHSNI